MKKLVKNLNQSKRKNQIEISFAKSNQLLDISSMIKIRGGEGEDNGGSEIIIPIPTGPKK